MSATYILLVDDEIAFVDTMAKRLTKKGFTVLKSFNGDEALEKLGANRMIDVVILDVKMPGKDGIETLKQIKGKFPIVEVIMLTGHATVETAIDGMKLGAHDYMMKPYDMDQMLEKIADAKKKKRLHEEKIVEARIRELSSKFD